MRICFCFSPEAVVKVPADGNNIDESATGAANSRGPNPEKEAMLQEKEDSNLMEGKSVLQGKLTKLAIQIGYAGKAVFQLAAIAKYRTPLATAAAVAAVATSDKCLNFNEYIPLVNGVHGRAPDSSSGASEQQIEGPSDTCVLNQDT